MMPSCDQIGVPIHFHSSTTSGSASLMSLRILLRVSPRQSPSSAILFEMSSDADWPWLAPDFFMFSSKKFQIHFICKTVEDSHVQQLVALFERRRNGSPTWTRTTDMVINSHPLYQLSYRGMCSDTTPKAGLSRKAFGGCQPLSLRGDGIRACAIAKTLAAPPG